MPHATSDVRHTDRHTTPAVSPNDRWDLLKQALGVDTQQEVAERTGVDLRTLQRMIERPERSLHGNVKAVCAASDIPMHVLFSSTADLANAA